jgi:hypothetical protein
MRLIALLLVFGAPACVQTAPSDPLVDALKSIDERVLKEHVYTLAGDDYEGRAAGFPGNEKAVEYIEKALRESGLKPAGEGGGFTQTFPFGREGRKARNVIALFEGADAKLKEEFVVIGGHLDHVGTKEQAVRGQGGEAKPDDGIWNGADDNASGTAAVLVVARALGTGKLRPKRSILFCLWNAEEAGLLGSMWWTRHATRPIDRVVYYLNLDMVGRNAERPIDLEGARIVEGERLFDIAKAACEAESLKYTPHDYQKEAMFRSDGLSFLQQAIPASMFFSYWHADYHKVGDHANLIEYPNLAKVARASLRIVCAVANLEPGPRLNVDTPLRGKPLRVRGGDVRLEDGTAGARIDSVVEGSVLANAGLQAGDVVVTFDGKTLNPARPLADLWRQVQSWSTGQEAVLGAVRGKERVTLRAVWPKRE